MKTNNTDVVAEYLREVDVRLAGLPVLQRRELLADLEAHIATERAERNLTGEGELIEVLERLGTPEAIAAAAREEFGAPTTPPAPPRRRWWPIAAVAGGVLLLLLFLVGFLFFAQGETVNGPLPTSEVATVQPAEPEPAEPAPTAEPPR